MCTCELLQSCVAIHVLKGDVKIKCMVAKFLYINDTDKDICYIEPPLGKSGYWPRAYFAYVNVILCLTLK